MTDWFQKGAEMTKRISGIARLKSVPHMNVRPKRKISRIAEILDEGDVVSRLLHEVADTDESRARGLMGRKEIPRICGMMFDGLSGGGYFWMKNCLMPIDVMFINDAGFITKIYTMNPDGGKKRYEYDDEDVSAIEVAAGYCKDHGILRGFGVETREISNGGKNG